VGRVLWRGMLINWELDARVAGTGLLPVP